MAQFILIGMCIGIKKCQPSVPYLPVNTSMEHNHTLKVEYLLPMLAFTKIIVLYNFRYKKLSKPCTQLLRYKQPVPYLPVNAAWTIPHSKSAVFPMPAFTKSTLFQTLKTFQTMYITKQILWHSLYIY